jgi:predicted small lipoprotein YifL
MPHPLKTSRAVRGTFLAAALAAVALVGCGGGNPLDNPPEVANPPATGARKLSFAYFQRCVQPILVAQLSVTLNGVTTVNSCASAGCHDDTSGTGGALRVRGSAADVDLATAAAMAEAVRQTDMYRNFYSAQGEVVFGNALASRLVAKPLVLNVLHGGGIVFDSVDDENVRILRYWIEHPMPEGQDEFSSAGNALFTPADALTGVCNVE